MDRTTRITRLRLPYRDNWAASDGAQILADLTGHPHCVWLDLASKQWHPRASSETVEPAWDKASGDYLPGMGRSSIAQDAELTPERARERGLRGGEFGIVQNTMPEFFRALGKAAGY